MEENMSSLTEKEKDIEKDINNMRSVSDNKRKHVENIISRANKNKSISLRIAEYDLNKLKEKAVSDNIPYQTLINSILHKYITNQLLDKSEVLKSLHILNGNKAI